MTTKQPEALAQECADYATSLRSAANVAKLEGRAPPVSFLRAADLFERAASRITELESQLAQRFDAADMATAAAQGFRDGVASLTAQAADSVLEDAAREAIEKVLALFPFNALIQKFSVNNGPCLTADNDDEFYSVKRVLAFLTEIKTTLDAARKQGEKHDR